MKAACLAVVLACACTPAPAPPPPLPMPPPRLADSARPPRRVALPPELDAPPPEPTPRAPRPEPDLAPLERTALASGFTVGFVACPDAEHFAVSLIVDAGGLDDRPGVAQLAANLIAEGAGNGYPRKRDFVAAHAAVGPMSVAVKPHQLVFRLLAQPGEVGAAIAHLGQLVARPSLVPVGYTERRDAAIQQADAWSRDAHREVAHELMVRALLGAGESTSRKAVVGTESELTRIRQGHVNTFYNRHVQVPRSWLLVAGPPAMPDGEASVTAVPRLAESAFQLLAKRKPRKLYPVAARPTPLDGSTGSGRLVFLIDEPQETDARVFVVRAAATRKPADSDTVSVLARALPDVAFAALGSGLVAWTEHRSPTEETVDAVRVAADALDALTVTAPRFAIAREQQLTLLPLLASDAAGRSRWQEDALAFGDGDSHGKGLGDRLAALEAADAMALLGRLAEVRVIVVFGDGDALREPLRSIGEVRSVDPRRGFDVEQTASFAPEDDAGHRLR